MYVCSRLCVCVCRGWCPMPFSITFHLKYPDMTSHRNLKLASWLGMGKCFCLCLLAPGITSWSPQTCSVYMVLGIWTPGLGLTWPMTQPPNLILRPWHFQYDIKILLESLVGTVRPIPKFRDCVVTGWTMSRRRQLSRMCPVQNAAGQHSGWPNDYGSASLLWNTTVLWV